MHRIMVLYAISLTFFSKAICFYFHLLCVRYHFIDTNKIINIKKISRSTKNKHNRNFATFGLQTHGKKNTQAQKHTTTKKKIEKSLNKLFWHHERKCYGNCYHTLKSFHVIPAILFPRFQSQCQSLLAWLTSIYPGFIPYKQTKPPGYY